MPKRTRIYTRTGDSGTTGLYSGARVLKNDPRVEAYGTVDELSSAIGAARAAMPASHGSEIDAWLAWAQDKLFDLGAELATPSGSRRSVPAVSDEDVAALERAIDESEERLEPLDTFIHPGGSLPGALLHSARTICRRAERNVTTLQQRDAGLDPVALRYLNRLSDALFVWARRTNTEAHGEEHRWRKGSAPP